MQGLLLMNLGTPDEPKTGAVRRYLREFLSDPRVIDINPIGRAALLNAVILPTRPAKSAEAYKKVWTERGSPLLFHSLDLTDRVRDLMGDGWCVKLAMRYGNPNIASALDSMVASGVDQIVVFPLFPHFASSSTGSALEAVYTQAAQRWNVPALTAVPAFYDDEGYIAAFTEVAQQVLDEKKPDFLLFSFHGLPERHMRKSDDSGKHCLESNTCCDKIVDANRNCYRAQCYATARILATRLNLDDDNWTVSFQSRLGRTPWIRPYTDVVLPELAAQGVKKLAVMSPAFVADCLETLEEIGIRADEQFREAGGDELTLVPSLNSNPAWARAVAAIAKRHGSAGDSSSQGAA